MGFALPIILILGSAGCWQIQNSISAYFYTNFVWLFCGLLFTIGFFLITYQGYPLTYKGHTFNDKWLTRAAGVLALGIAIFPTDKPLNMNCSCHSGIETYWSNSHIVHIICAGLFFITTAFISAFVFTRTHNKQERLNKIKKTSEEKIARNWVFYLCGGVIGVCMIFLITAEVLEIFSINISASYPRYVFYNETIMLFAFGTSWLVKGETLFADGGKSYKKIVPKSLKNKFYERANKYNKGLL